MMKTVDYPGNLKVGRLSGPHPPVTAPSWEAALFFIGILLLLHGGAFAESAPKSFPAYLPQPWAVTGFIPGDRPVYADFDGDHKRDLAKGVVVHDHYEILVSLSTRSEATLLHSPVPLAGFTLHAIDVNHDSYPDVVAVSPTERNPLAVWLGDGKGNFTIADRILFETDSGFARSPEYQKGCFHPDPDFWTEPLHLFWEPSIAGCSILPPASPRISPSVLTFYSIQEEYSRTTPRSPPLI